MTKIKVTREGRVGIYLPDRESLKAFIRDKQFETIHNIVSSNGPIMLGADHTPESVLSDIDRTERAAVLTGEAYRHNMKHALALIMPAENGLPERLETYDIGEITENDLLIEPSPPAGMAGHL